MNDIERAVIYSEQGFSCCQAVLATYGPHFGLERESALKLASGLGGGIGHLGETCGAVIGAIMIIGLKHGGTVAGDEASKKQTYGLVKRFLARFKARYGSILCRELLGYDVSTLEGLQAIKDQGLFDSLCPDFVRATAEILEEVS